MTKRAPVPVPDGHKFCWECQTPVLIEDFPFTTDRRGARMRYSYCRECCKVRSKTWRDANLVKARSQAEQSRKFRWYGLTPERYAEMLEEQGGACAICGTTDPGVYSWRIDHDHLCCPGKKTCGRCVRQLLCGPCNTGLGSFRDDPALFAKALQYLRNHSA